MKKVVDIIFLVRPTLLCAASTFFFAGVVAAGGSVWGPYGFRVMVKTIPNFVLFVLVVSFAFVVNQIHDVQSDTINRKNYILPQGVVTRRESHIFGFILLLTALVFGLSRGGAVRSLSLAGLVLGFMYSVPPLRLKGRPILDMLANVAGFGLIGFAMGWLAIAPLAVDCLISSVPYMIALAGIFLNTCIPDEEGDRIAGDRTSCVVYGRKSVGWAALILLSCSAVAGMVWDQHLCAVAVLAGIPVFVAVALEPSQYHSVLGSQVAARLLFVLVSIKVPLLAMVGLAAYLGSKFYYAKRFGVIYPRLAGAQLKEGA